MDSPTLGRSKIMRHYWKMLQKQGLSHSERGVSGSQFKVILGAWYLWALKVRFVMIFTGLTFRLEDHQV